MQGGTMRPGGMFGRWTSVLAFDSRTLVTRSVTRTESVLRH